MWPATLIEVGGMSKHHPFVVAMQIGENSAYKHSDYVVSLLPYAEEYMKQHGLAEGKFVCIPNGVVEEEWENPEPLPEEHKKVFDELHREGKFIVGYFGGHALSNALGNLIAVADKMKEQADVHFVLVGDGVEKKNLIAERDRLGLQNVTFLKPVSKKAVPSLCQEFDCIYMGGKDSPLYRFGLCLNKMFDSMMAGKPIICAITTPRTYIEEYECGYRVDSESVNECINVILKIKNMPCEKRSHMGEQGRLAAINIFNYSELSKRLLSLV